MGRYRRALLPRKEGKVRRRGYFFVSSPHIHLRWWIVRLPPLFPSIFRCLLNGEREEEEGENSFRSSEPRDSEGKGNRPLPSSLLLPRRLVSRIPSNSSQGFSSLLSHPPNYNAEGDFTNLLNLFSFFLSGKIGKKRCWVTNYFDFSTYCGISFQVYLLSVERRGDCSRLSNQRRKKRAKAI